MRCPNGPYFTKVKGYPANPKTIGEAIRKRRVDLDRRQIDAATLIGCHELTVVNWEKGQWTPHIKHLASMVRFLGYKCVTRSRRCRRSSHGLRKISSDTGSLTLAPGGIPLTSIRLFSANGLMTMSGLEVGIA
jgi:DNA-binding XRE family transcriptional regulator